MAIIRYSRGADGVTRESVSNDGGKTYTETGGSSSNGYSSSYSGGSTSTGGTVRAGDRTGPNYSSPNGYDAGFGVDHTVGFSNGGVYQGKTGKSYEVAGSNNTITVRRPDGTVSTVRPGDANYNATMEAMKADVPGYTPTHSWVDGYGNNRVTKDYTSGNSDLQYALQQAAQNSANGRSSTADYVKSLYNRVGSQRADGTTVTLDDVVKELGRLGLSDYAPGNAVYTTGGNLLPGNEYGRYGTDATGDEGQWYFYGGQQYRTGGDQNDFAQYVNGKTGNLDNLSFLFGNMANNPYAQSDPNFMNAYNAALQQFNQAAYPNGTGNGGYGGGYTGNTNVDNVIQYLESVNNYNTAAGGAGANVGTSNLLSLLQSYLDQGLNANKDFLAQQRTLAQQNAEELARQAYVNHTLANDSMRESLSANGLGTSGALQSAQMGLQGAYNSNLADINSNLNSLLSNLNEQELQMLSDYYNNMTQYAYNVSNDEANRALQQAQLDLQAQQQAYEQAYQQQMMQMQQAQADREWQQSLREYDDSMSRYQDEQDYERRLQQAEYFRQLYGSGDMNAQGYSDALRGLGLISGNIPLQVLPAVTARTGGNSGGNNGNNGPNGGPDIDDTQERPKSTIEDMMNLWYTGKSSINPLTQLANYTFGNR